MANPGCYDFWGKAEKNGSDFHPAVCHMLDVGIMARELLTTLPAQLQTRIRNIFGDTCECGLAFFSAIHDIGKISPGFVGKRMDLCDSLKAQGLNFPKYVETNHGKIAAYCLPDILMETFDCSEDSAAVFSQVLAAHHGVFFGYSPVLAGGKQWNQSRIDIACFLAEVFELSSLSSIPMPSTADALLFAGMLTLSDWLGSSEKHFPFVGAETIDIHAYIEDRTDRAGSLLKELQMMAMIPAEKTFAELFPFSPNPCQEAVLSVAQKLQHPMLIVVESPMGTGKTEAAQAAYSLLAPRNHLRGMYYALPTQATGNAMFSRMKDFLDQLNLSGQTELHLLHANADLNPEYEALKLKNIGDPGETGEGSVVASAWFTARKRGLLACYGVGTIDQALMAVLKVRHFFLRLFGLAGKLLVLDEVHAYDAYMSEEITCLVSWLRHFESSVILLSATLPKTKRQKLLNAFITSFEIPNELRYPCVIGIDGNGEIAWEEIRGLDQSSVTFNPIVCSQEEKAKNIISLLMENLTDGGCAACILNTVSEAQEVYEAVKKNITDAEVILFHSRFTMTRRLEIESKILGCYGKNGIRPFKGIVVATQVLEQSLDIDFDFMVSDLAPIDLLLQRAGRLHRHLNIRPSLLKERILHVLLPKVLGSSLSFGGSGFVYFPDILAKTALLFIEHDKNRPFTANLPYDISQLIETVYRQDEALLNEGLQQVIDKWAEERIGKELAGSFTAREATLANANDFLDDPVFYLQNLANDHDEERLYSSRLGRPNITVVILESGEDIQVRDKADTRRLYGKSLVTDNPHLVRHFQKNSSPEAWKDVVQLRHCYPIFLSDGTIEVNGKQIFYDDYYGLRIHQKNKDK